MQKIVDKTLKIMYTYNCQEGNQLIIADRQKGEYMNEMTDKQFDKIFQMFEMILEGCKDLDDAKRKVKELRDDKKEKEKAE